MKEVLLVPPNRYRKDIQWLTELEPAGGGGGGDVGNIAELCRPHGKSLHLSWQELAR
jgi:hypothetical protein